MLIVITLSVIWFIIFIIRKMYKPAISPWRSVPGVLLIILPLIIFCLLTFAQKANTTLPVIYVTLTLIAQTQKPLKKLCSRYPKKYIPFLYLIGLSLLIGLFRFGLEWCIQNSSVTTNASWEYWLTWTEDSGWDVRKSTTILIKNLISGLIIAGISMAFYNYPNIKRKKRQLEETQLNEKLTQVELETLYAKINPEFLHHSLQTIADMALVNGETTREMSLSLSRYFRYCMNKEERNLVTPAEEIEMTRIFLEFEQLQYPGKLEWHIRIPDETDVTLAPRLLLPSLTDYCIRQAWQQGIAHLQLHIELQSLSSGLVFLIRPQGLSLSDRDFHSPLIRKILQKLDLTLSEAYALNIHPAPANEIIVLLKMNDKR